MGLLHNPSKPFGISDVPKALYCVSWQFAKKQGLLQWFFCNSPHKSRAPAAGSVYSSTYFANTQSRQFSSPAPFQ